MKPTTRISLWSGPRNISTALMYSFAQRTDTKVFDEPLYAHYLRANPETQQYHPGAADVLGSLENDGEKVVGMMLADSSEPVLFFKNMTHHLAGLDWTFCKQLVNVILTRHPKDMLPSFAKVIDQPQLSDVGYKQHLELATYFHQNKIPFVVLDSTQILMNPKVALQKLCDFAQIPFMEEMLAWEAGKRPEDGIWAQYWYGNVHQSTGFQHYKPKSEPFPNSLEALLEECLPYYEELYELSKGSNNQ